MEKKKFTNKKYDVRMSTTNGTIISTVGDDTSITINERIIIGGVQHFKCSKCKCVHPKGHEHLAD